MAGAVFKTRTEVTSFVAKGKVRITRGGATYRARKASVQISVHDVLTFARNGRILSLEVLGLATRRVPPAEARALYADEDET